VTEPHCEYPDKTLKSSLIIDGNTDKISQDFKKLDSSHIDNNIIFSAVVSVAQAGAGLEPLIVGSAVVNSTSVLVKIHWF
jgi:hypothetical protein